MEKKLLWGLLVFWSTWVVYGEDVKIEGVLKTRAGQPVVNASVRLAIAGISSTTNEDGTFGLYGTVGLKLPNKKNVHNKIITLKGGQLLINGSANVSSGSIQIFRADGSQIHNIKNIVIKNGINRISLPPALIKTTGMFLIRCTIGKNVYAMKVMGGKVQTSNIFLMGATETITENALLSILDTLVISNGTMNTIRLPLTSFQCKYSLIMDSVKVNEIDTSAVSQSDVIAIAQAWKDRASDNIPENQRTFIDADLKLVTEIKDDSLRIRGARGLSSAAMAMMGKNVSYQQAILYAAEAVLLAPTDPLTLNNFGALLRDNDSLKTSLKVLIYARSIAPWAPAILTNLGNTLFELGDVEKAEHIFLQAIQKNPQYGPAHKSLGTIYFTRGWVLKAADHLVKAAEFAYTPSITTLMTDVIANGGGIQMPPNAPTNYNPSGTQRPDMSSMPAIEQLTTPDFPNWSGIDVLGANFNGIKSFEDQTTKEALHILSEMNSIATTLKSLDEDSKVRIGNISKLNERANKQLEYLIAYYSDRSAENQKKYEERMIPVDEALQKAIDQINGTLESKEAQWKETCNSSLPSCIESYAEIEKAWGRDMKNAYDTWFGKWKQIEKEAYEADRILAEEFWLYSAQYLDQIYDGQGYVYKMAELLRRQAVCNILGSHASKWSAIALTIPAAYAEAVALAKIELPQFDPVPEPEINIPKKEKGPSCPFENGKKLKANIIAVSIAIDCESIEIEGGEGIIAGGKYNFKTRETELSISAGLKAGLGVSESGTDFEIGGQSGITLSFDKNGQPADIGFKTQVSATARVANQTLAAASAESTIAVSGISQKYTFESGVFSGSNNF